MKPKLTEAQWLAATTLHELHLYWTARQQHRKWRLFGVACCRRAMALRLVERFDELAEAAEQFADSILNWEEMKQIRKVIPALRRELDDEFGPNEVQYATLDALECATREKPYDALGASHEARHSFAAQLIQGPNRDVSGSDWDAAHS